jgi:transposase
MQGEKAATTPRLFTCGCVEQIVPQDDYYRRLEKAVDFSFVSKLAAPFYAERGRPSVDPEVLAKIMLIGYLEGIASERRLMRHIQVNLSYRRFLGYDIDEEIPDHSTLSKARERFGSSFFKEIFQEIVRQCDRVGLISWESAAADATLEEADASFESLERRRPETSAEEYAVRIVCGDKQEEKKERRKEKVGNKTHKSRTDEDARIAKRGKGKGLLAYLGHRLVDSAKRVIVGISVSRADICEGKELIGLVESCREDHGRAPDMIAADKKYGSVENLKALAEMGIEACIPIQKHVNKKGLIGREEFEYCEDGDYYVCPEGKVLKRINRLKKERSSKYRAEAKDCLGCPKRKDCCSSKKGRMVSRNWDERYVIAARERAGSRNGRRAARMRRSTVELSFAEGKQYHNLRRAQWRGLDKVLIQNLLSATAQNIKRLVEAEDRRRRMAAALAVSACSQAFSQFHSLCEHAVETVYLAQRLLKRLYKAHALVYLSSGSSLSQIRGEILFLQQAL